MFFQRKKKRLLRELWRARLAKPPPPSDYYATSCLAASPPVFWTATTPAINELAGAGDNTAAYCCEAKDDTRTRSTRMTRNSFGLMGHCCCGDAQSTCSVSSAENHPQSEVMMDVEDEEAEEKAFLAFLGKNLVPRQLETLLEVITGKAGGVSGTSACVLVRRQEVVNWSEDLPVIACRMWNWADLDVRRRDVLKRIPSCPNGHDPVYICCNPSHWFRVLQPEIPPPPYSASLELRDSRTSVSDCNRDRRRRDSSVKYHQRSCSRTEDMEELPEYNENDNARCGIGGDDNAPHPRHRRQQHSLICRGLDDSSMTMMPPESSVSTHGQGRLASGWCSLAYWEQSNRVGDVTEVFKNTVNVVSDHSANDDVCLTSLAAGTPKLVANATRCKIGPGITISHEGDSMWLYNRSTQPVFVHSLTISDMDSILGHSAMIQKLWPGHCLRAYNPKARTDCYRTLAEEMSLGPVDVHSVRISFVKGWGQTYKRQDIKSCPCWLEVYLNPCHFIRDCYESYKEGDRFSVDS